MPAGGVGGDKDFDVNRCHSICRKGFPCEQEHIKVDALFYRQPVQLLEHTGVTYMGTLLDV